MRPTSPGGSSLPDSSRMRSVALPSARPAEPGLRSASCEVIEVT
jgi:hypothetical protein